LIERKRMSDKTEPRRNVASEAASARSGAGYVVGLVVMLLVIGSNPCHAAVSAPDAPPQGAGVVVTGNPFSGGKAKNPGPRKLNNVFGMRREIEERGFATVHIQFAFNDATIQPESRPQIENIDTLLREEPSWCLRIVGHTDAIGDPAYNQGLSEKRAEAVRQRLLELGIEKKRLSADGMGMDQPVADNRTSEGRTRNRRVELVKTDCLQSTQDRLSGAVTDKLQ
jgi:outer membrane protein OmpA-like peptidoglycan-associated protein